MLSLFTIFCVGNTDTSLEKARKQKEAAICQLKATKSFYKEIRSINAIDNIIVVNSDKYDKLIEKYGSECETYCLDINKFIVTTQNNDDVYSYSLNKKKLECAIREQIKCDKCTKHSKCKCYRKIKRKCRIK